MGQHVSIQAADEGRNDAGGSDGDGQARPDGGRDEAAYGEEEHASREPLQEQ